MKRRRARCALCRKKLPATGGIKCRCGKVYCGKHRVKHDCQYDYKKEQQRRLEKANPLIEFNKITKI